MGFQMKKNLKKWEKYLTDRGVYSFYIENYIPYITTLYQNKVPIIFELDHLSDYLGIKKKVLLSMIFGTKKFYRHFLIPKRMGGKREIFSPYPSLLNCQKWIYKNILLQLEVHPKAQGFIPNRSIFSNAVPHLNTKVLLKMDLKDFFPSIPINWVIKLFLDLGYARNVSFYLASLCCVDGMLAQGAATSPYLSNILLKKLDDKLDNLAKKNKLNYTRYADDLTFSGQYISYKLINTISKIVVDYGLNINEGKTRLYTKKGQRIVTGLSVTNKKITIPRKMKREIKTEIYYLKKLGLLTVIARNKIRNPYYLDSILGKLNFWKQAEPFNKFVLSSIEYIHSLKTLH